MRQWAWEDSIVPVSLFPTPKLTFERWMTLTSCFQEEDQWLRRERRLESQSETVWKADKDSPSHPAEDDPNHRSLYRGGRWGGEGTSSSASSCFLATSQPTALSVMVGCRYPGPLSAVSHGGLPHSKIKGTAPAQETDQTKVNLSCRPPSQNWGPGNHTPLVRRQVRQHHCNCLPPTTLRNLPSSTQPRCRWRAGRRLQPNYQADRKTSRPCYPCDN